MQKTTNMGWPRIFAEVVAIVASILLAFGIDAWWQDRQIRLEEQQILQDLNDEFLSIRGILERHLTLHLEHLQWLEDFLNMIEDGPSRDAGTIVEAALLEMVTPTTSDIGNGTLNALLGSGRVDILTSRTLRAKLAAWDGVMGEVWDDQNDNAKMVYEIHVPYFVAEGIPVGAAMRRWYEDWPIPARSISEDPDAIRRLLEDPRFHVMVEVRYGYKRHLTQEFEHAIAAAEAILTEIAASREER